MASKNSNYSILVDVELDLSTIQKQLNEASRKVKFDVDSGNVRETSSNIRDLTNNTDDMTRAMYDAELSFQAANEVFHISLDIISSMVDEVFDLDSALTNFKKVSDLSGDSLNEYVSRLSDMGNEVGRTGSEMVEASTEFRKNGFNDEDAATLAQVAA